MRAAARNTAAEPITGTTSGTCNVDYTLIRAKSCYTGDREGRRTSLTPAGRRAFHCWPSVPMPLSIAGVPPDALRTRLRFLGALPTAVQKAFVKEAQVKARHQLRVLARDYAVQTALWRFQGLMSRGAILSMRGRLSSLDEVSAALSSRRRRMRERSRPLCVPDACEATCAHHISVLNRCSISIHYIMTFE